MKIKKRDQEAEIVHALRNGPVRFDSGETAFITRELLAIKSKVYETEYPTLRATEFVPMASDTDAYAENIAYQQTDEYGKAKIVANDASDLPDVNSQIGEATTPVKTIAAKYKMTWLDLQRSARSRVPLAMRLARAAHKSIAEGIDNVTALGDTLTSLIGFTDVSTVHVGAAAAAWSGATALQMYTDMITAINLIPTNTKGTHQASNLLLPISSMALAKVTPWSATGASDLTVLKFFEINNPGVKVDSWYRLETAGASGVKRMIVYDKNPDVIEGQLPLDYTELPPQWDGLAMVIPCLARVGGVQCRFPKAIEYTDGL